MPDECSVYGELKVSKLWETNPSDRDSLEPRNGRKKSMLSILRKARLKDKELRVLML